VTGVLRRITRARLARPVWKAASTIIRATAFVGLGATSAQAAGTLHVYGPSGPMPAMMEAAAAFGKANDVHVEVTAGPTPQWIDKAKADADLVFSGSEAMMSDLLAALPDLNAVTVTRLYLRSSAILVRAGNPGHILGIADLLKPEHHILVVDGSGQQGLWEDVAGRLGDIRTVRMFPVERHDGGEDERRRQESVGQRQGPRRLAHLGDPADRQSQDRRPDRNRAPISHLPRCGGRPDPQRPGSARGEKIPHLPVLTASGRDLRQMGVDRPASTVRSRGQSTARPGIDSSERIGCAAPGGRDGQ